MAKLEAALQAPHNKYTHDFFTPQNAIGNNPRLRNAVMSRWMRPEEFCDGTPRVCGLCTLALPCGSAPNCAAHTSLDCVVVVVVVLLGQVVDTFEASDVQQGVLGDCYLLSAMSVLAAMQPRLLEVVLPVRTLNPLGVYPVRIFKHGRWEVEYVDDRFPMAANSG